MRWIFALLLMGNVFYAFWQFTAVAPALGVEPGLPADTPRLVLLSERQAEVGGEPADQLPPAGEVAELDAPRCWVVGPLAERAAADSLRQGLEREGLGVELEAASVEREPDYWVHIGPFASRERASAVLRELRAKNVDSFLIVDGELTNAISLGLFSQEERARRLQRERGGLGHEVRIHRVVRTQDVWNLRVMAPGGEDLEPLRSALDAAINGAGIDKKICN